MLRSILAGAALALGLLAATGGQAQGLILTRADLRAGQSLDGQWTYSIDPYRDGLLGFHRGEAGVGHRRYEDSDVDAVTRADPTALYEYDMQRSATADLPASWLTHTPELRHYQGLVWYQRRFQAKPPAGQRAFLRFEAVNYTAKVYLNGKKVGEHEGGFTPFSFEVTDLLRDGENNLTVGVDSTQTPEGVPPPVTDWENYGGLTRSVKLVYAPQTFVDDAWVRLDRQGRIAATVHLDGTSAAGQPVTVRIAKLGLTLSGTTDAQGAWTGEVKAPRNLARWSPKSPTLYDVTIAAAGDQLTDRVGLRTLEAKGGQILLNGKPIFLRGISLHEEELGENPSRTMTEASARALLMEAKDGLDANFVRLAHYPHAEITTRLADEMGLLVWSEIPVYWLVDFANPKTLTLARSMLAENIRRDRNRASIAFWSVANETPVSDARNRFLGRLVDDVRALDDTRLVTAALLANRVETADGRQTVINDPLGEHLDVLAVNTYSGWYGDDTLDAVPSMRWAATDKPLIFSEFGADAKAGFSDPQLQRKFSEDFQARYYVQTLAMVSKVPTVAGMSPWVLKDFRAPRRQHPLYQQGWNRKGLISPSGQRKAAFEVLANFYRDRAREQPDP
ncbi:glycoside hydrolase family 2 protein [Caulobacter sp. NIBR2454]|uniref:glycoside hydrolase family 2 protein n=1 Tax=Caulobacter sp. NIBR2454 TaxID=3015996 RepID=UPI0022B60BFA|nr:glycoside hydrolase family 2 TIM barrel-domain containing protein [Caulobacter sp. NIBR2454]